jgi:hypothetical protein
MTCGTLAPPNLPLAALDGQPEKARAHGTLAPHTGKQAARGQTAQLSLQSKPAEIPQFVFMRTSVRYLRKPRQNTQNEIPECILYWSLTPELTGVRVERFVRLGRAGRVWQVNSKCI